MASLSRWLCRGPHAKRGGGANAWNSKRASEPCDTLIQPALLWQRIRGIRNPRRWFPLAIIRSTCFVKGCKVRWDQTNHTRHFIIIMHIIHFEMRHQTPTRGAHGESYQFVTYASRETSNDSSWSAIVHNLAPLYDDIKTLPNLAR